MSHESVRFATEESDLEGLLELPVDDVEPVPAVVVCHPHPLRGGDMYNDVVGGVARALVEQGIATLRFNFRGTGGSRGEFAGGLGERDDVWAALDFLRGRAELDRARLGLAGYSFGAGVALNAGIAAGVKALAAISVPPEMVDFTAMRGYEIPVLVIAGDQDGMAPADRLTRLVPALGPRAMFTLVQGADHFWGGHLPELTAAASGFFGRELATRPSA